jgi:hypothetical protein
MTDGLNVWVITKNPTDFPRKYVVRLHCIHDGKVHIAKKEHGIFDDLDDARESIPFGHVCLARHPNDDSVIVETWL